VICCKSEHLMPLRPGFKKKRGHCNGFFFVLKKNILAIERRFNPKGWKICCQRKDMVWFLTFDLPNSSPIMR